MSERLKRDPNITGNIGVSNLYRDEYLDAANKRRAQWCVALSFDKMACRRLQ